MQRTSLNAPSSLSQATTTSALPALLSQSEDGFYGSLQRIWNHVLQLEDLGLIHQENDKFVYAYRFAEAELERIYCDTANVNKHA
ncbi:hypothetical protein [Spirosoma harenae]